ncbi:MAG: hypothetical protein US51_C0044G0005 [Microgenomates group bacterium GW2011_GWA2_37_6]|nr:MAG: hypothetical protein US51_C0044G0005 [Microgenomates group bacterium GW2011_GWA2_37_6]
MDTKSKILDIAMNLNRVGNFAADGYAIKQKRIKMFLDQTSDYISSVSQDDLPTSLKGTYLNFLNQYKNLEQEGRIGPKDELLWAEKMMTWGNILTHRASLIK